MPVRGISQGFGCASPLKPPDQLIVLGEIASLLNPVTYQFYLIRLSPETLLPIDTAGRDSLSIESSALSILFNPAAPHP